MQTNCKNSAPGMFCQARVTTESRRRGVVHLWHMLDKINFLTRFVYWVMNLILVTTQFELFVFGKHDPSMTQVRNFF